MSRTALRRLLAAAALTAGLVAVPASPAVADACQQGSGGVTVVVDFGSLGGGVRTACTSGDPSSGLKALTMAGFGVTQAAQQPGFVCRINGVPAADPCVRAAPSTAYWAYWHAQPGGGWTYSSTGAGAYDPKPGTVEGWRFGAGEEPSAPPPPERSAPAPAAPAPAPPPPAAAPVSPPKAAAPAPASTRTGAAPPAPGTSAPPTKAGTGGTPVTAATGKPSASPAAAGAAASPAPSTSATAGASSSSSTTPRTSSSPEGVVRTAGRRDDDGFPIGVAVAAALVAALAGAAGRQAWVRREHGGQA